MKKPVCVIVGAGPGNGAAFAARFLKEGFKVALLARSTQFIEEQVTKFENTSAYVCDVTKESSVQKSFNEIKRDLGDIDVIIYNAGSGHWGNIEEISSKDFESNWRVNALGLMLVSQQVIPMMKNQGRGNIIIIGATASKRGGIKTASFAPAKAAQRSLAESMAKYLGPYGIHVALVMIDGVIDVPKTRAQMPDKPDSFFVKPNDVASTVFWLTQQPSSTWSFEIEIRPFSEPWG